MGTAIFIRTFLRDAEWLRYCVRGIERYCRGFDEVVVHADTREAEEIGRLLPAGWRIVYSRPWCEKGYINQQLVKLHAWKWVQSDEVCFVDSDVIFHQVTRPEDLRRDGKLMILWGAWTAPSVVADGAGVWRPGMEAILGGPVPGEFMRRFTLSYRTETLRKFCAWLAETKGQAVPEYLSGLRRLSEFNVLGAWAYQHERDNYCWLDVERDAAVLPELRVTQLWSHSGCTARDRVIMEELLER